MSMYQRLKDLREDADKSQEEIAKISKRAEKEWHLY